MSVLRSYPTYPVAVADWSGHSSVSHRYLPERWSQDAPNDSAVGRAV